MKTLAAIVCSGICAVCCLATCVVLMVFGGLALFF